MSIDNNTSVTHPFPFEHPAVEHNLLNGGDQYRFNFTNGFGASVVCGPYTYGGPAGLWELAVLEAPDWHLCYSTPVTDDVLGWLTPGAVAEHLDEICRLGSDGPSTA